MIQFSLHQRVENDSLAWAKGPYIGIVSYDANPSEKLQSQQFNSYLDIKPVNSSLEPLYVTHREILTGSPAHHKPFDVIEYETGTQYYHEVPARKLNDWFVPLSWIAAIYLMAEGDPPIWYQILFDVSQDNFSNIAKQGLNWANENLEKVLKIIPINGPDRPIVAVEQI